MPLCGMRCTSSPPTGSRPPASSLALTGARPITLSAHTAAHGGTGAGVAALAKMSARTRQLVGALAAVAVAGVGSATWLATRSTPPPMAARLDIALPDSVTIFSVGGRKLALSRDGSRLLFVGVKGTRLAIYLRRLDDPVAQVVRGTEGAVAPASGLTPSFSPDGEWILYADGARLLRVPVGGGSPLLVTDTGATGSWGDGGAIVFVRQNALYVTTPEGGAARKVAAPDTAHGVYSLRWPSLLPGGEHVLVAIDRARFSSVVDSLRLGVVSLKDGTVTDLGMPGTNATYVTSGHVVFGRAGGIVMAAPFSLSKRAFTGPATQLLESVWQGSGGATGYAVSDNGTLVYHAGAGAGKNPLVVVSRAGRERLIPGEPTGFLFPRISPDGRRIAVSATVLISGGLWLVDAATGARERLAAENEGGRGEWTRDGSRVVFLREGGAWREVVARSWDRSGEDRVLLRDTTRDLSELALGAAHGLAALRGSDRANGGRGDIFLAPLDSLGAMRPFVATRTAREFNPAISPDGRYLAYLSDESGNDEIYVQPIPGPGPRVRVSVNGGIEPIWGRTGSTVYYRGPGRIMLAELGGSPLQVTRRDSLFADVYDRNGTSSHQNWDIFPGGNEFVMARAPRTLGGVSVVLNWRQLLTRQRGTGAER